jgi:hypothetical protein
VTEEAFEGLCEFMRDKSEENKRYRLKAIEVMMTHAWGHPPQAIAIKPLDPNSKMSQLLEAMDGESRQLPEANIAANKARGSGTLQ